MNVERVKEVECTRRIMEMELNYEVIEEMENFKYLGATILASEECKLLGCMRKIKK